MKNSTYRWNVLIISGSILISGLLISGSILVQSTPDPQDPYERWESPEFIKERIKSVHEEVSVERVFVAPNGQGARIVVKRGKKRTTLRYRRNDAGILEWNGSGGDFILQSPGEIY